MTGWQKASYPLVGALILLAFLPNASAPGEPRLELTVLVQNGAFVPSTILIPSYGTVLNLTIRNEDATLIPAPTFTIRSGTTDVVDLALNLSVNWTVEFTVTGPNAIRVGTTDHVVTGVGGIAFRSRSQSTLAGLILVGVAPPDPNEMPVVYVRINATTVNDKTVFVPDTIRLPQTPVRVHALIVNTDPSSTMQHSFSFRSGATDYNYWVNRSGDSIEVEFEILAAGRIRLGGAELVVEQAKGGTQFFCLPHRGAGMLGTGMLGTFVVGAEARPESVVENGVFLRAYWIGLVGIFATILLMIVAYWVIKGQSVHHRDHSGHVRRGLP